MSSQQTTQLAPLRNPALRGDAWIAIWSEVATVDGSGRATVAVQCLHDAGASGTLTLEGDDVTAVAPFVVAGGVCERIAIHLSAAQVALLRQARARTVGVTAAYVLSGERVARRDSARLVLVPSAAAA